MISTAFSAGPQIRPPQLPPRESRRYRLSVLPRSVLRNRFAIVNGGRESGDGRRNFWFREAMKRGCVASACEGRHERHYIYREKLRPIASINSRALTT